MNGRVFRLFLRPGLGLALALIAVTAVLAGGFYLSVERPPASTDPLLKDAVLMVRPLGCQTPSQAKLTATAEGLVDGKRQSRPLRLRAVSEGVYAVHQQWPSTGTWVLALTGRYRGLTTSALVELGPDGTLARQASGGGGKDLAVRVRSGELTDKDIDAALAVAIRKGGEAGRTAGGTH